MNSNGLLFIIRDIDREDGIADVIVDGTFFTFTLSEIIDAVGIGFWTFIG